MSATPLGAPSTERPATLRVHGSDEPEWLRQRFEVISPGIYEFRAVPLPRIGHLVPANGAEMNGWGIVLVRIGDLPAP
jgi:hypothetical protein